jgi:hypothetical protein
MSPGCPYSGVLQSSFIVLLACNKFSIEPSTVIYSLWNNISDDVARIEEPNLQEILAKIRSEGLSGIEHTLLTE